MLKLKICKFYDNKNMNKLTVNDILCNIILLLYLIHIYYNLAINIKVIIILYNIYIYI